MPVYKNKKELQDILSRLWAKIFNTAEIVDKLSELSLVVEFRFTDIETRMFIVVGDGRKEVMWDPENPVRADVEMILPMSLKLPLLYQTQSHFNIFIFVVVKGSSP